MQKTYEFGKKPTNTTTVSEPAKAAGNPPLKRIQAGALSVAIWENEGTSNDGTVHTYRTVTFDRRYKDKSGEWKSSNNLRINDLPKAALILQKAYEYLLLTGDENDE